MQRSDELEAIVRGMYEAMETNDFIAFEALLAHSPDFLMIGTDPGEWWAGFDKASEVMQAQLKEMQGNARLEGGELAAFSEGDFGWFADRPRWIFQDGTEIPFRLTGVFRREDEGWRLVQGHTSIGVPNQDVVGFELTS